MQVQKLSFVLFYISHDIYFTKFLHRSSSNRIPYITASNFALPCKRCESIFYCTKWIMAIFHFTVFTVFLFCRFYDFCDFSHFTAQNCNTLQFRVENWLSRWRDRKIRRRFFFSQENIIWSEKFDLIKYWGNCIWNEKNIW